MRRSSALLGVGAALLATSCSDDRTRPADHAGAATTTSQVASASVTVMPTSGSSTSDLVDTTVERTVVTTVVASPTDAPTTTSTPPVTAASIAAEIAAAERGIRDTSLAVEAVAGFGRRQQRVYQQLARNTDLHDDVAALIPADVATAFWFNVAARHAVVDHAARTTAREPSSTLPAWTILEPRPIDELLAGYQQAEAATEVPWEYLAAINLVETRMGRISGESSAGALGPMQFLPTTWAACCIGDIDDPHDAILGAATYLTINGAPDDMGTALYGYNPNQGYVDAVTAYASNLMADPLAYRGYHAWEVYVASAVGTVRLPVGYSSTAPVDALEYVRTHPDNTL